MLDMQYEISEQEIVGSYSKGVLKIGVFILPVFLFVAIIPVFGRGPNAWASIKPILLGLLFYYAILSGYIFFNPKWVWDMSYLRLRMGGAKPEPTKFYFTAVRIAMLIITIVSLSFLVFIALFL